MVISCDFTTPVIAAMVFPFQDSLEIDRLVVESVGFVIGAPMRPRRLF